MDISQPVSSEVSSISFSLYSAEEIRKGSVKAITSLNSFDVFGQPVKNGLYDPALGACDTSDICSTCGLGKAGCPGHFGHIELPAPVFNVLFFEEIMSLLKAKCFYCHKFRLNGRQIAAFLAKFKLFKQGLTVQALNIDINHFEKSKLDFNDPVARANELVESVKRKQDRKDKIKSSFGFTKTTNVKKEIDSLTREVLRSCGPKSCPNCKGESVRLRHDSYYKVFQSIPTQGTKRKNQNASRELPNVFEESSLSNLNGSSDKDLSSKMLDEIDKYNSTKGNNTDLNTLQDAGIEDIDETQEKKIEVKGMKGSSLLLTPLHMLHHLNLLFEKEKDLITLMYSGIKEDDVPDPRMFFYEVLPVPPSRFRPATILEGLVRENPQTTTLTKVLYTCKTIHDRKDSKNIGDIVEAWVQLQRDVNSFIDINRGNPIPYDAKGTPGIKQVLEKKEGLFRKHMMGKRVNYAARSVISPDPNLETNEIGIPPVFATTLTYPEPVTHYNVKKLRDAVIRGPKAWPGATHVQHEDGTLTQLDALSTESRVALANQLLTPQDASSSLSSGTGNFVPRSQGVNKKVFRHIENGDVVLMNRQPTLHKPSIMAHKVRVLPGEKTIRMHYANCNTYNADFDGDEMNLHFPQNEVARSEAYLIANTDNQYLVPTNGAPLRGLIQDHVATGVIMTSKETFFTREQYMQLLYGTLKPEENPSFDKRIIMVPPAIIRPVKLWTGKQVITTIMKNLTLGMVPLTLKSKCRVPARYWDEAAPEEGFVVFNSGEFVTGCLDKNQFGASSYGLIHSVYELYGASYAGKLLSIFGRLFTKYCQHRGFTCRMDDLGLTKEGDEWRRELLKKSTSAGQEATISFIGLHGKEKLKSFHSDFLERMQEVYHKDEKLQGLDATMKSKMNGITSSIIQTCIPNGLYRKFPENHMQVMTVSGAKGSNVNVSQISCLLGQQELEGRRVPLMASGKTLPSFQPYETSARAGGFISGRFLTGIKPQEYFFHCMAGREGLIDTAVKTSRSGYLQRCLIKHLEGLRVHYDYSVRDADGSILQFYYGEDGLDVTKQSYIDKFEFSANNYMALKNRHSVGQAAQHLDFDTALGYNKKAIRKPEKYDPTMSVYSPAKYFGSVSEKFYKTLDEFMNTKVEGITWVESDKKNKTNNEKIGALSKRKFRALMNLKYLHSLADPGEAVGLLAAQSVGEPSTQMTLNTFHFAGFGAKNVTLGIPRLREIVMTASKEIQTPSMTLVVNPEITEEEKDVFCKKATKLRLSELVDDILVEETLSRDTGVLTKKYKLTLNFFPSKEYIEEHKVNIAQVERSMIGFSRRLEHLIKVELRRQGLNIKLADDEVEPEPEDPIEITPKSKEDKDELDDEDDQVNSDLDDEEDTKNKNKGTYDDDSDNELKEETKVKNEIDEIDAEFDEADEADEAPKLINHNSSKHVKDTILAKTRFIRKVQFDSATGSECVFDLHFPVKTKKLLLIGLASSACHQSVVREIPNIERVFPITNEAAMDTRRLIATEGLNIQDIWRYSDIIDVNSIETNDINAMLEVYGVEACRNAIMREIGGVFAVYGIGVDPRHLSLIADYMTFEGGYRAFNRLALKTNPSPLQQMSFETTTSFLTKAVVNKDIDSLDSPSARIVMGKVVEGGTGAFGIHQPLCFDSKEKPAAFI